MKVMSITWKWLIKIFMSILSPILEVISPTIKAELNAFLTELYLKALSTPNAWDDLFVGMLLDILAIPRPPPG